MTIFFKDQFENRVKDTFEDELADIMLIINPSNDSEVG